MNCKNRLLFSELIFLVLVFTSIFNVGALGITPGRTTLQFEPGVEKEIELNIINNEHKSMNVLLSSIMQGELGESVSLFEDHIEFSPDDERKSLKYKIRLPDEIEPGLHTAEIVAVQTPSGVNDGTFIGATVAVISQIYVYVPCPGKCIDADLEIIDAEENNTMKFIIPVISRGKLMINNVRAIIDIYDLSGNKIDSIESSHGSLSAGARVELIAKWDVDVPLGDYKAKATIFYDEETKEIEKRFTIGVQTVSIDNILVNDFVLGEIAKIRILVENKWNQELKEVYANLLIYNKDVQVIADIKSSSDSLPALARKELITYWDTSGIEGGEYEGKLYVHYGERTSDKNLLLNVGANSLDITGVGYVVRGSKFGGGFNLTTILVVLVILLLLVNVAWFVFFKRVVGKKEKNKKIIKSEK